MECRTIRFTGHALRRMFERELDRDAVVRVIHRGEVIARYPDDRPFPSQLLLGFADDQAVHVVVAQNPDTRDCFVVTAYQPDPAVWSHDFKTRRTP
jgi:hypothetical protein